ncbi:MAG: SUMF1/EgtB/PvdO family nonheme iron enzyme [Tannerellaceae bacterium]|nr:SUMF1/EgtB/PvdO family nonheme iron enzyme [Tannerellaceae bacterium]
MVLNKLIRKFFLLPLSWGGWLGLFLLLVSCDKDDKDTGLTSPEADDVIRFEVGIAGLEETDSAGTKVATGSKLATAWEDGDAIGLFVVARLAGQRVPLDADAAQNYIHNLKIVYNSSTDEWEPEKEIYWKNNKRHDFYAYYPYDDNMGNPELINPLEMFFTISADQSDSFSYLMTAKSDTGRWRSYTVLFLHFQFAVSMIEVQVPVEGKGFGPSENLTVKLRNVKPGITLNLNGIQKLVPDYGVSLATENNDPVNFTMQRVKEAGGDTCYVYRASVPVQELGAAGSLFWFEHEDRQLFTGQGLSVPDLQYGKVERYQIPLPKAIHTVEVPAGYFIMGTPLVQTNRREDEVPHGVTLTNSFRMSKYPVTNTQFASFLNERGIDGSGVYETKKDGLQLLIVATTGTTDWGLHWNDTDQRWDPATDCGDYPVVNVTWYGADEYARWVGGRLPTEAQWEYACRAGTDTYWSCGNTISGDYLWYDANSSNTSHIVGTKLPNNFGLYDMHGLVNEWCSDWYGAYGQLPEINPTGPDTGATKRVFRGGSFNDRDDDCRSASRFSASPDSYGVNIGFRVVF